jgi:hypothetical protein
MPHNIQELMSDGSLEQKIVFAQDTDYQSSFNNNSYSYILLDDCFGNHTAVKEARSGYSDVLLREHLFFHLNCLHNHLFPTADLNEEYY